MVIDTKSNKTKSELFVSSQLNSVIWAYLNKLIKVLKKGDWSSWKIIIGQRLYFPDGNFGTNLVGFDLTNRTITLSLDGIMERGDEYLLPDMYLYKRLWIRYNFKTNFDNLQNIGSNTISSEINIEELIEKLLKLICESYVNEEELESRFKFWKQIALGRSSSSYDNFLEYITDEKLSKNSDLILKDLLTKYFVEYSKKNPNLIKDSAYKFGYDLKEFEKIAPGIITSDIINDIMDYNNYEYNKYYQDNLSKSGKYSLSLFKFFLTNYQLFKENVLIREDSSYRNNLLVLSTILFLVEENQYFNTTTFSPKISALYQSDTSAYNIVAKDLLNLLKKEFGTVIVRVDCIRYLIYSKEIRGIHSSLGKNDFSIRNFSSLLKNIRSLGKDNFELVMKYNNRISAIPDNVLLISKHKNVPTLLMEVNYFKEYKYSIREEYLYYSNLIDVAKDTKELLSESSKDKIVLLDDFQKECGEQIQKMGYNRFLGFFRKILSKLKSEKIKSISDIL